MLSRTPTRFLYQKFAIAVKVFQISRNIQCILNNVIYKFTFYGYQQINCTFKKRKGKECAVKMAEGYACGCKHIIIHS